jgi:uncharacterized membrane protein
LKEFIFKYKLLIFAAIVILHLAFKSYKCGDAGLWYDECFSVQLAEKSPDEIIRISMYDDPNPPLYGVLLHYWVNVFGDSETEVRTLSVFASSLAAGILFLLCLNFFNWQTSVFASLMFFTSNELYYYGLEARTYALIILFVLCSYYLFLSIIKRPTFIKAILFAVANACIFYSHFLACFVIIGEIILFPILALNGQIIANKNGNISFNIDIKKKLLLYLSVSGIVFTFFLWPWKDRTIFLLLEGGKAMWLAKPTYVDFKNCIYEFFNSKVLYQAHIYTAILFVLLLLTKRFREEDFNWKMILFALIIGPGLIYFNYFAANFTPIFLKRYILYSFLGFIFLYSYLFSMLRFPFLIKLGLFIILSGFSFSKLIYPRPPYYQYKEAVPFLKEAQKKGGTLIINDLPDVFSYYYDKNIFKIQAYNIKYAELLKHDVYIPFKSTWYQEEDFSMYHDIYYTRTFSGYYDPQENIAKQLEQKYKWVGDGPDYFGIKISHYINLNYKPK